MFVFEILSPFTKIAVVTLIININKWNFMSKIVLPEAFFSRLQIAFIIFSFWVIPVWKWTNKNGTPCKSHFVPLWIHCESVSPHFVIFLDNHCHNVLICCQQYYLTWYFLFYWPLLLDHLFSHQLQCRTCGMSSLIQKKK